MMAVKRDVGELDGDAVERADLGLARAVHLGGVDGASGDGAAMRVRSSCLGGVTGECAVMASTMRLVPATGVGPADGCALGLEALSRPARPSQRVHLEMYADVIPGPMRARRPTSVR